jgi:hypothetical protein
VQLVLHPHFLARYQYPRWRLEGVWAICCRYWPQKFHDHVSERCVAVAQSPARHSWKQALVVELPRAGQILMIIEVSADVVYERVLHIRGGVTCEVLLGCGAMSSPLSLPYQSAAETADALQ